MAVGPRVNHILNRNFFSISPQKEKIVVDNKGCLYGVGRSEQSKMTSKMALCFTIKGSNRLEWLETYDIRLPSMGKYNLVKSSLNVLNWLKIVKS